MTFIPTTPYSKTTLGVAGWLSAEFFHLTLVSSTRGRVNTSKLPTRGHYFALKIQCMRIMQFATVRIAFVKELPQKQWQWKSEMVEQLLTCLKEYKIEIDYINVDFNADVVLYI